jgi:protein-S-isoprenylcysteine O-methyltransferase Ste14
MSHVAAREFSPGSLKMLVGSGDRIGLFAAPFLLVASILQVSYPGAFGVGGPSPALELISLGLLAVGIVVWAWSVALILSKVPKRELITSGPYAWVKHPLYTSVALLLLPSAGFLLDTWLGVPVGIALYVGHRLFSPGEERALTKTFGAAWDEYVQRVRIPWL